MFQAEDNLYISILDVWQINVRPDHKIITGKEGEPLAQREERRAALGRSYSRDMLCLKYIDSRFDSRISVKSRWPD